MRRIAVLSLFFVPGGRVQGTIYRKPVYEREAGLYRG